MIPRASVESRNMRLKREKKIKNDNKAWSMAKQVADGWAGVGICVFALLHGQAKLEFGIQRVKIQNLGLVTWNTA